MDFINDVTQFWTSFSTPPSVMHLCPRPYTLLSQNALPPPPSLRNVIFQLPLIFILVTGFPCLWKWKTPVILPLSQRNNFQSETSSLWLVVQCQMRRITWVLRPQSGNGACTNDVTHIRVRPCDKGLNEMIWVTHITGIFARCYWWMSLSFQRH